MATTNFDFLRQRWPDLATPAADAEGLCYSHPSSACVHLRIFSERFVNFIYQEYSLPRAVQSGLHELITDSSFQGTMPSAILTVLFVLKDYGNRGAHGKRVSVQNALFSLSECHKVASWMWYRFNPAGGDAPNYKEPIKPKTISEATLKKEKKAIAEQLADAQTRTKELLEELKKEREKSKAAELSNEEKQKLIAAGEKVVEKIAFDEAATRRHLIDTMIETAGWDVGTNGEDTEQVKQEVEVFHQSTPSGKGRADYVLFSDNGQPLAVIEAKASYVSSDAGRTQAKCYADGLEKMHGARPAIFYTNGWATWLWDDAQNARPRNLYGFYSPDSLQHLVEFQRSQKKDLSSIHIDPKIAGRLYQIESIKRILERFKNNHRKSLLVQATGTGKTRVAISICKALLDACWAKRILFLCDRKELRKQARLAFKEFLPNESRVVVNSKTYMDRDKRIYFATYQGMIGAFETFDVGFFDLVIADESHRSIYNRYRELLLYFDALTLGLTATPIDYIQKNTFTLFGCEDGDPTAKYTYDEAIKDSPPSLVPFHARAFSTEFQRRGIKYSEMSDEQKQELEDQELDFEAIEFEPHQIDKKIFNKDSNRKLLRNLMENGIRDASGTAPGKSIIFARSIKHADLLEKLFDEMYPQYGGKFCRKIVSENPKADELIDDLKRDPKEPGLTIAISVDMLDTGIDVPDLVNLVFAKPVYSYVKFWQMIGRGTRLCPNLFGPNANKTHFLIFDHWSNFAYFDEDYVADKGKKPSKSLPERLFSQRLSFAHTALELGDKNAFQLAIARIEEDLKDLPKDSIAIKEKWELLKDVQSEGALESFSPAIRARLRREIAPLMQWRDVRKREPAVRFDMLIARLQEARVRGSTSYTDLKDELRDLVDRLPRTLSQVKKQGAVLDRIQSESFWADATVQDLEDIRLALRGLMKHIDIEDIDLSPTPRITARVIDVTEDSTKVQVTEPEIHLKGLDYANYRQRVQVALNALFEESETLQKIKVGQPVTEDDIESLCSMVLAQDSRLNLRDMTRYFSETAAPLDRLIRGIIGLDTKVVNEQFQDFVHQYPSLTAQQVRFLSMLKNHIGLYGSVEREALWEAPYTVLNAEGVEGVFEDDEQFDALMEIVDRFGGPLEGQNK